MNFEAFKSAPWFDSSYRVIIGGLGNIGSWTSLLLARMGYELYLYDFDKVEHRNVGSQFYGPQDVGLDKTTAMKKHIHTIAGNDKVNLMGKYDDQSLADNIMISCFDNMIARKVMFTKWLNYQLTKPVRDPSEVNIFIDGRTLAESGTVYAVKSRSDVEKYKKCLFSDEEAEEQPCSLKSTSHNGSMIASLITSTLANHIANKKDVTGLKVRHVPFATDYQLQILNFV